MDILVVGGTRFFGIPMIENLIQSGHSITIATRGITKDRFGDAIERIIVKDIYNEQCAREALGGLKYDVVIDKMGYGAGDVRNILENITCTRFVHMSTAGVYQLNHMGIHEDEFDACCGKIEWWHRGEASYDEVKRSAERVLAQQYPDITKISVRYPFVIGENDYTNRLKFYVSHVIGEVPMFIDNIDEQLCFIDEQTAGKMLAEIAVMDNEQLAYMIKKKGISKTNFLAINGCLYDTISVSEILTYIEWRTGKKAIISEYAEPAPYNHTMSNSLDISMAQMIRGKMPDVKKVMWKILDSYIDVG